MDLATDGAPVPEPELPRIADALAAVPVFATLDGAQRTELARRARLVRLPAGTVIARQGEPVDGFYAVLEGSTEWARGVSGEDVHAVTLAAPSVFAELVLILGEPWPTTGRAVSDVVLAGWPVPDFWSALQRFPAVLRAVLRVAVERAQIHETVSQQHARLLSLGTLAAGLAHELNNPAAGAARAVADLEGALRGYESAVADLAGRAGPLVRGTGAALAVEAPPDGGGALDRSAREDELEDWLADAGVADPWRLAPELAAAGLGPDELAGLVDGAADAGAVLRLVHARAATAQLLAEAADGVRRVSDLVGAVRAYSAMDSAADRRPVDVAAGVGLSLIVLAATVERLGTSVVRDDEPGLPRVTGRPAELNQVWTALLDNALDAAGPGGTVRVRTRAAAGRVVVDVEDDGPGIAPDAAPHLFEPFFTTKPTGEGTGLGLSVAAQIVRQHDGEVRVERDGGWTRFSVHLPAGD